MPAFRRSYAAIPLISAAAVVGLGILAMAGWIWGVPSLTTFAMGSVAMKMNTAVAFALAGVALWIRSGRTPSGSRHGVATVLAIGVAAVGLVTLLEHAFSWDSGLDELLVAASGNAAAVAESAAPGRMAPAVALAFLLLGIALLPLPWRRGVWLGMYQACAGGAFLIGLLAIIGYLYGVTDFYQFSGYGYVAPMTACGLLGLSLGVLWARPDEGVMQAFASDNWGGQLARWMWLPTIVSVVVFGAVVNWGEDRKAYDGRVADLLFTLGTVLILSAAIWFSTRTLNRSHLRILHRDRLYALLSEANFSIVRLKDHGALFAEICRIAVINGRFRSAWIGLIDHRATTLVLVTQAEQGAALSEVARELGVQAVRENQPMAENRLPRPDGVGPGEAGASLGAFPIALLGRPLGVLVVESAEPKFFQKQEINLLTEVAANVSFALETMERDAQRLAAEQEVRESQERLQLATAAANIGFWDWNLVDNRVYFSPEWKAQIGLELDEVTDAREEMQSRIHPDDRARVNAQVQNYLNGGSEGAYESEFRLRHKDGSYRWIYSRARALREADGRPTRLVGWHVDITARRLAEEAVRERETRLKTVVENLTEGLVIADLNGQLLSWNRAAMEILGFEKEQDWLRALPEFIHFFELSALDGRVLPLEEWPLSRILRGEVLHGVELSVRRLDLAWQRTLVYGGTIIKGPSASSLAFLTINDVTERTRAEKAVRESEARFRELADHVDEVFWITDPINEAMLYVSPAYEKIWGRPVDELYRHHRTWLNAVHPEDRERVRGAVIAKQKRGDYKETYRIMRPDGTLRWIRDRAFPVKNPEGEVYRIVGTAQDITARKLAELYQEMQHDVTTVFAEARSLNEAAERVLSRVCRAMEWSYGELWMLDRPAACLRCAEVWHGPSSDLKSFALETRERSFSPAIGLPGQIWLQNGPVWSERLSENPEFERKTEAAFAGLQSAFGFPVRMREEVVGVLIFFASYIAEPDAEVRTLADNLGSQFGQFLQRTRIEEQFRQSQKMEAIGQLAGGVAHDFNNVLTVIKAYPQLIALEAGLSEESRDWLQQISLAADRAASLTRQLLAFSRKQVMQVQSLHLSHVVEGMGAMLRRIIGEDITLVLECAPHLDPVEADPGMMEQVLLNLVVNARDAMPAGGRLVVQTGQEEIEAVLLRERPRARTGRFVTLSVTDNGSGMSKEVMAHIFEPFFTTKGVGKGTGLGLATVHGIAEQHHGWVEVESTEGRGSTFKLFLPATRSTTPITQEQSAASEIQRGSETILLVEDEPAVRVLNKVVLERLGYRVYEAVSGVAAFQIWADRKDEIDILVTDMVMPAGVTGRDLAEKLRGEKSTLRVLFTTGYSPANVAQGLNLIEGVNFIQKPFVPQVLAQAVRKCLERPPERLS